VGQCLLDVLGLEVRILAQDLLGRHVVCHEIDHERNRDTHPADARAAPHDLWIECDSIKHENSKQRPQYTIWTAVEFAATCSRSGGLRFQWISRRLPGETRRLLIHDLLKRRKIRVRYQMESQVPVISQG